MSNVENTWSLISSGDLFTSERLAELQTEFSRDAPGQSDVLGWLLKKDEITEYHRKVFETGHSGPFRYGDYTVRDRISGGFFDGGFCAVHSKTSHPVILHFLAGDNVDQQWPKLRTAAYTCMSFDSPYLARYFETDENDDFKFLVYEDFNAVPVTSILAKSGQLKPRAACDVIRRIGMALQPIHQAGYSHGHISAKNVRVKNKNIVKLFFDPYFQFVPLVKANTTPDPHSLVQVDYSAPELAIPGNRPDQLTDIYALGCLFYELLTGKPPFPIGNIQDRMQQHATQHVKPLENLGHDKNLAQFVYFMMAKDRGLRFQTVGDVLKQLDALPDSGKPKPTPPPLLKSFASYDKQIRAKLMANDSAQSKALPGNLLPASNSIQSATPPLGDQVKAVPQTVTGNRATVNPVAPQSPGDSIGSGKLDLAMDQDAAHPTSSYRQRQKASVKKTLIPVGITLAALLVCLVFVYIKYGDRMFGPSATKDKGDSDLAENREKENKETNGSDVPETPDQESSTKTNDRFVEDDQRTLWESPTAGHPITMHMTPPGLRLLLSVQGEQLFANDTQSLLAKSLGPSFLQQTKVFEDAAGISWREAKRVNFSVHDNNVEGQDRLLGAFVVEPVDQKPLVYWLAKWGDCTPRETSKGNYYSSSNGWAYYTADKDTVSRFLVAPESLVKDVVEGQETILLPHFKTLLESTDSQRHLNLVVVPADLTSPSGVTMFDPQWLKIIPIMDWYLGGEDKIQVAFLSMHFDNGDVYLETGLKPQLDKTPFTLAEELRERISRAPEMAENYMLDIDADRHWKKLARKIPDWVKSVSTMSRVSVENKITIANCWQEASAPHNLLAGLEYTLTFAAGSAGVTTPSTPTKKTPTTIEELLEEVRTIEIANDDLNIAVDKIITEIKDDYPKLPFDFKITINGNHLMDDGITKNQRLVDFKVENKSLGDILAQFVFTANPDKTAKNSNDPKTKLIWVIHSPQPGEKVVLITTRKAAAREGYTLPKQFVPQ